MSRTQITSGQIADNSLLDADISSSAGIQVSKLESLNNGILLARKTSSAGAPEKCSLSEVLDFIGSATAGDILYRGASAWARLPKGTDGQTLILASGLPSWVSGKRSAQIQIVADASDVDTTSGVAYFKVPSVLNGTNLIRAQAFVTTAGTTNATTIQVRNLTKYSSNDSLSTAISIASGGTVGTAGTVNTSYDDVSTDDNIKIYVTAQSTTKPKGLYVVLEFQ
jgi:hypothetical protein